MAPETDLSLIKTQSHPTKPSAINRLDRVIISVMTEATVPLSSDDIRDCLAVKGFNYSRQHIKRRLNQLKELNVTEVIGKRNKTELFRIVGQVMEPWEATSISTNEPLIEMNGKYYTPDLLARDIRKSTWSMLTHEHERDLKALLELMILGSAAYPVLKAHSIRPVGHVRAAVENYNARLKVMTKILDTILHHERIMDGSTGNQVTNATKDLILGELEDFITNFSVNVRSDVGED